MESFKIYDYDPRKLPKEILSAIGLVTTASAQTESIIEMGIGGCLGIRVDYSRALTAHMNSPLRDQVLRACAEIRIDDLDSLDLLDEILDEINTCFTMRNGYVHRTWCRDPETGDCFISKIEARGSLSSELIQVTAEKIRSDALLIYEAGLKLMSFLRDRDLFASIPDTPLPSRAHKMRAARKKRRKERLESKKSA